jgi:hypothetical protein
MKFESQVPQPKQHLSLTSGKFPRSSDQWKEKDNREGALTSKSADKGKEVQRQSFESAKKPGSSSKDSTKKLFAKIKFIFSGIAEKLRFVSSGCLSFGILLYDTFLLFSSKYLREKLEQLIKDNGGQILSDIPKDFNYYELYDNYEQYRLSTKNRKPFSSHSKHHRNDHDSDDNSDENEEQEEDVENEELKSLREPKEMILLISQAKDFRKPKFINCVILGIPILHSHYLFDCITSSCLQSFDKYYLPISYSALHSYYLFPLKKLFVFDQKDQKYLFSHPSSSSAYTRKKHGNGNHNNSSSNNNKTIFQDLRILNLTGIKIWDDILSLCRVKLSSRNDKILYKQLLSTASASNPSSSSSSSSSVVDIIVFDPISFNKSFLYHSHRIPNQKILSNEQLIKQNLLLENEVKILQHCHTITTLQQQQQQQEKGGKVMKVVSIDWITHCIAMNTIVPINPLDLFTLPSDPVHYPMAFKMESTGNETSVAVAHHPPKASVPPAAAPSGERYSKYDLVYFNSSNNAVSASSSSSSPVVSSLSIGKILSFSRRNEMSIPLVKIQLIDPVNSNLSISSGTSDSGKRKYPDDNSFAQIVRSLVPRKFTSEMIISVSQLAGKVVALHRKDYYRTDNGFQSSACSVIQEASKLMNLKEKEMNLLKGLEEEIYCTTLDYERQFPLISLKQGAVSDDEDEDDDYDHGDDHDDSPKKKRRFVMSQDI